MIPLRDACLVGRVVGCATAVAEEGADICGRMRLGCAGVAGFVVLVLRLRVLGEGGKGFCGMEFAEGTCGRGADCRSSKRFPPTPACVLLRRVRVLLSGARFFNWCMPMDLKCASACLISSSENFRSKIYQKKLFQ